MFTKVRAIVETKKALKDTFQQRFYVFFINI